MVSVPTSTPDSMLFGFGVSGILRSAPVAASPGPKLFEAIGSRSNSNRLPKTDSTFVCWDEAVRRGCGVGVRGGERIGAGDLVAAKDSNPGLVSSVG